VRRVASEALGILEEDLKDDTPLMQAGMTSQGAEVLRVLLAQELQRPLPRTLALDHPTVGSLARFLAPSPTPPKPLPGAASLARWERPLCWRTELGAGEALAAGAAGCDAAVRVPLARWDVEELGSTAKHGVFLEDLELFQAEVFHMLPD
ncbi:unnamed protein product, partial [Effrenium voratum]